MYVDRVATIEDVRMVSMETHVGHIQKRVATPMNIALVG